MEGVDLDRYDAMASGPFQLGAVMARVGLALSVSRFEATNAAFSLPGLAHTVGVDAMMVDHFDHGRIAKFAFIGLTARPRSAETPSVKAAEAEASDIDFSRLLSALSSPSWSPGKSLGRVSVGQASASGFSGDSFKRYGLSLGKVTLETSHEGAQRGAGISRSRLRVAGFALAPPTLGTEMSGLRLLLDAMDLKALRLDLDCAGGIDRPKGEFAVDRCRLAGDELGTLDFDSRLVGADDGFWRALERGDYFALLRSKVALASARLTFADNGLLERALHAEAAEAGQASATVRAAVADEIRHYQPAGVLITEDLTKLLETVARFIEQGGTLAIDLKPDPPFVLATAGNLRPGPDLVELLGATATQQK
jgi:hypothetical protein